MTKLQHAAVLIGMAVVTAAATGCVAVKPWERELLARPDLGDTLLPRISFSSFGADSSLCAATQKCD